MVVGRGHIGPPSASQRAEDAPEGHKARQLGPRSARQQVPEADQGKARAGRNGDEELEDGSLRVPVAYRCGDGGEPLLRVAKPLVLDDLVVVEGQTDEEGAEEGGCESRQGDISLGAVRGPVRAELEAEAVAAQDNLEGQNILYATTVCNQLIHTPLKVNNTPPSLSLYFDVAILLVTVTFEPDQVGPRQKTSSCDRGVGGR